MAEVITNVKQVTPDWLTRILRASGHINQERVTTVELKSSRQTIISDIHYFQTVYTAGTSMQPPSKLFLKLSKDGFDSDIAARFGKRESEFYNVIAKSMDDPPSATCYDAAFSPDTGKSHLLLADLSETHFQTDWPLPPSKPHCEAVLDSLAKFHASWWDHPELGKSIGKFPSSGSIDEYIQSMEKKFAGFVDFLDDRQSADRRRLFERVLLTAMPNIDSLSPTILIMAMSIMMVGAAIQSAVGIGLALIVVPLLVLLEARFVPGPMLFASIILALATAWRERGAIAGDQLKISLLGLVISTAIGAAALSLIPAGNLPKVFGLLILVAVIISVSGFSVQPTALVLVVGAAASGIMGTMVGIHGPPIALVFQNAGPERARANLGAFFAVGYSASVAALVWMGVFGPTELALSFILIPGVLLGWLIGPQIARFLNTRRTRAAILSISAITACVILMK
jgi:uncharacterized membrane protein YfcA